MKRIIKPAEKEEAAYFSDFSGKPFGELYPEVSIKIEFNYGSKYDEAEIELHLTDEESSSILELIKSKVSEDFKRHKKKILERFENDYDDAMQMRDWDYCDRICNNLLFWREFLEIKDNENN